MYTKRRPKGSKLSEHKFRQIIKCFILDLTAQDTSKLICLHRHTVNKYYWHFRSLIYQNCINEQSISGKVEVDESYFGPRRIKGKKGRGAYKKTIVFGMLKREGKVFTWIVENCKIPTIVPIIDSNVKEGTTIYSDDLGTYRFLYVHYDHKIVFHGKNEFANKDSHINGIESFWAYAKHRLIRFKGIRKQQFPYYLKETEWRFNHRNLNKEKSLINLIT